MAERRSTKGPKGSRPAGARVDGAGQEGIEKEGIGEDGIGDENKKGGGEEKKGRRGRRGEARIHITVQQEDDGKLPHNKNGHLAPKREYVRTYHKQ